MMRLPFFRYLAPTGAKEAAGALRDEGPDAMLLAGGTDLLPNMKRRQQRPKVLVATRRLDGFRDVSTDGDRLVFGAGVTLSRLAADTALPEQATALFRAAAQVATPLIRSQATLGGNICLDTRCNYYNQNAEWRQSIDFCMKAPKNTGGNYVAADFHGVTETVERDGNAAGSICWVAPGSPRCWAVNSSDSVPALIALDAEVELTSADGERRIPIAELFHDDGMSYLTRRPDEILTRILVPTGWTSTYWKLRRRGSFDFPVLGVGAAIRRDGDVVTAARMAIGGVSSAPLVVDLQSLVGRPLDDDGLDAAVELALKATKPMDNTDLQVRWRRQMTKSFVRGALRELRGEDPSTFGPLARHARRELPVLDLSGAGR